MKQQLEKIYILIFLLSIYSCAYSQTLDEYFVNGMKNQLQINQETRSALLKKYKSGKGDTLKLQNGGETSVLEYVSNNYLKIKTSEDGFFSLKRWSYENRVLFAMSWWVCGVQCDGIIKLNEPSAIKQNYEFPAVSISDFLDTTALQKDNLTKELFAKKIEIEFIHYEFSQGDTIWAINNTYEYLDKLRKEKYKDYWRGNAVPIVFSNGSFQKGNTATFKPIPQTKK